MEIEAHVILRSRKKRPFVAWLLGIDIAFTSERRPNQSPGNEKRPMVRNWPLADSISVGFRAVGCIDLSVEANSVRRGLL